MGQGILIVLSGPSGAGKSSILREALSGDSSVLGRDTGGTSVVSAERDQGRIKPGETDTRPLGPGDSLAMSVSCTTREPRSGETEGVDYFFLSKEDFMRRVEAGEMAEHAEVFGSFYGTPKSFLEENMSEGSDVITDIDVQGARQLKEGFPNAVMVFVVAPSKEELERRLRLRRTENEDTIRRRLETAEREMAEIDMYDYVVVNDVLVDAAQTVSAIRRAEHAKKNRIEEELT